MMLTFNEAYKSWRNIARKYTFSSLFEFTLNALQIDHRQEDIMSLQERPWNLLLLMKWICQDHTMHDSRNAASAEDFHSLRQRLWEMPAIVDIGLRNTLTFRLFIRRIIYQQLMFQRRWSIGFLREAALIDSQPTNNPLRTRFERRAGYSLAQFSDLSLALLTEINQRGVVHVGMEWFTPIRRAYSAEVVHNFIKSLALSATEMISFFRSLQGADRKTASEFFEFTPLARFPLIRTTSGVSAINSMVLTRGLEQFVHSVLSTDGEAFIQPYSKIFERHVIQQSRDPRATSFSEDEIIGWLRQGTKVSDCLMAYGACNVIVESKSGIFGEDIMTVGHTSIFEQKTRGISSAVRQAQEMINSIYSGTVAPNIVRNANDNYLVIVTNRELGIGTGRMLAAMYPEGRLDSAVPGSDHLPLDRIFIASIDDFEALMSAARCGLDLPAFFAACIERNSDPQSSLFFISQHMQKMQLPYGWSNLVSSAADGCIQRLKLIDA